MEEISNANSGFAVGWSSRTVAIFLTGLALYRMHGSFEDFSVTFTMAESWLLDQENQLSRHYLTYQICLLKP